MPDRVGQQLGNYRLIRLLGQGGFADVYLTEHIHLDTQAAIKVLHTQLAARDVEQFRLEARTIAHLEHPHIVRVLEFGVEGTMPFLVMSYAPNGTLRERHPRGEQLSLSTVVNYVKQIADALQYAHDQKVIHRDIKPENMLLGRRNEILLSDFGIALVAQSSHYQSTKDMAGTVAYMAPEQIEAHPRPASDQYSLGIVVYEWLAGNRPFHGTFTEVALKHSLVPPPSLRGQAPMLSSAVEQVVMTALAKDPKERFGSVEAFATALEQASQSIFITSFDLPTLLAPANQRVASPEGGQPPSQIVQTRHADSPAPPLIPSPHNVSPSTELETSPGQNRSAASSKRVKMSDQTLLCSVQSPGRQRVSQPIPRSRKKQLTRDILAVLSVGLSPIALLLLFTTWPTSFPVLIGIALIFIVPYTMGILGAAFSGRKGFDALFPVCIGGVLGTITFLVFVR